MAKCGINVDIIACLKIFEEEIRFSTFPKKNKKKLEDNMQKLKRAREDVTEIFQEQQRSKPGTKCKVPVKSWLDAVNEKEIEVLALLESLVQSSSCSCFCSPGKNYRLGKEAVEFIDQIKSLLEAREKFDDDNLVSLIPYDPIENIPDLSTPIVGREETLSEIHGYLKEDSPVATVGIWGMGGIGKTTMLKSIKQELSRNVHRNFDYVVWIDMSGDVDILNIQQQIASCIFLSLSSQEERERRRMLINALRSKKSLVLIDNVWKRLEFDRIGIPLKYSAVATDPVDVHPVVKVMFTTRSENLCSDMKPDKILRLDLLDAADSLKLFQGNISSKVDLTDTIVRRRVDEILKRCGGLPLVILTVARTVANYTQVAEWDNAVDSLTSSREEIDGMDDVMKCLKFSYDQLEDHKTQSCLLYFSLFPTGVEINFDELIRQWRGEGFLDTPNDDSFRTSYRRGVVKLNKLRSVCLVEQSAFSYNKVKVHDLIRHMICWIREHENKEVFVVYNDHYKSNVGKTSDCNYDHWNLAKRINLTEGQVKDLPERGMPSCPHLTTLLVQAGFHPNRIKRLPTKDFFHFTPCLRILDLSWTGLAVIPKSICELVELRYLNLYRTLIHTLPMELGNLKKLKCLDLGDTTKLTSVVGIAISHLSVLQSLNLFNIAYQWSNAKVTTKQTHPLLKLEDLRELKKLEDLGLDVRSNSDLDAILRDKILMDTISRISFIGINFKSTEEVQLLVWISKRFPELVDLIVDRCDLATDIFEIKDDQLPLVTQLNLRRLKISSCVINASRPFTRLKVLQIIGCEQLKEVSWAARIPSLEELLVHNCKNVTELVVDTVEEIEEAGDNYFPMLYRLRIKDLENLKSIRGSRSRPLLFPALRRLFIENCPKLKQLSLRPDSAKNMEFIKCEMNQWDLLEWENNDQVREKFLPYVRASLQ